MKTKNRLPGLPAVSSPSEELILVDSNDCVLGHASKLRAHAGDGMLHRAFSVFLFDSRQRLLLHRRSALKPLWPGYWTNSCCSHPRRGEQLTASVNRRLWEELGCEAARLQRLCAFEYHARYADIGSEHELCHVFVALLNERSSVAAHPQEISEMTWVDCDEVDAMMREQRPDLTPWFRKEWALLRGPRKLAFDRFLNAIPDTGAVVSP
ncbi:MAG: isopentenyl-diphosphate Delta-isomerase [Pseudomonadota bacterium]